ncbi:Os03g0144401 [Oryza sativa Japonica Group]|uniref:Os03g0144401 protein n=1 Tax=Oryza sativa subsp. japonica TaxID=39947 RepID=A0A0P0VT52_ORYSJ|nr:Os03g0144401 [Oryza sativa Japonica Group]
MTEMARCKSSCDNRSHSRIDRWCPVDLQNTEAGSSTWQWQCLLSGHLAFVAAVYHKRIVVTFPSPIPSVDRLFFSGAGHLTSMAALLSPPAIMRWQKSEIYCAKARVFQPIVFGPYMYSRGSESANCNNCGRGAYRCKS